MRGERGGKGFKRAYLFLVELLNNGIGRDSWVWVLYGRHNNYKPGRIVMNYHSLYQAAYIYLCTGQTLELHPNPSQT